VRLLDRIESTVATAVGRLPASVQRIMAGRPVRVDGLAIR